MEQNLIDGIESGPKHFEVPVFGLYLDLNALILVSRTKMKR